MNLKNLAFFFICALTLASCTKEENYTKWLTASDWKVTALTYAGVVIDDFDFQCNEFDFDEDGSMTQKSTLLEYDVDNNKFVDCANATITTGSWELIEGGSKLKLTSASGSTDEVDITTLTSFDCVLENSTYVITMEAQ